MTSPPVRPLRVLIIEDEPIVAMAVESTIEQLGHQVVGPIARLDEALTVAEGDDYDCALVDVNILGGASFAVTKILVDKQRPFILATGYRDGALPENLRDQPRLVKPYSLGQLEAGLDLLFEKCRANC